MLNFISLQVITNDHYRSMLTTKLLPLLFLNIIQELQDRVGKAMDSNEEMVKIRKEIVDFHGEMVLLENYSALNFTGTNPLLTFSFLHFDKFYLQNRKN